LAIGYRCCENWTIRGARVDDEQTRDARVSGCLAVREPIRKWLREVANATSVSLLHRSGFRTMSFLHEDAAAKEPAVPDLLLKSLDDPASERVILDPNQLNSKGTTAIDFYVPSLDGRYVARIALGRRQ